MNSQLEGLASGRCPHGLYVGLSNFRCKDCEIAALAARLAEAERLLREWVADAYWDLRANLPDLVNRTRHAIGAARATDSAPAAPERRACTCLYPTPAKYVPDFCGMCHGRITSTADAGHSVQCSECGATHVLRYTDRAKTAVSLAGFDGWSVDSSRVRCPKCSTASTADEVKP